MVHKECPSCHTQLANACRKCTKCGHEFIRKGKQQESNESAQSVEVKRRRTERIRKDPDFYSPARFQRQLEKARSVHAIKTENPQTENKRLQRVRPKCSKTVAEVRLLGNSVDSAKDCEEEERVNRLLVRRRSESSNSNGADLKEEDIFADLSPEKLASCAINLAEINRKIISQQPSF